MRNFSEQADEGQLQQGHEEEEKKKAHARYGRCEDRRVCCVSVGRCLVCPWRAEWGGGLDRLRGV